VIDAPATMILCAGLGTRLRPLSDWRAKPLVPVGDRPALAHVLERVRAAGAPLVVVNAHHRAEDLRAFLPADVALAHEAELLGTAGGVANAASLLGDGDVVVWNGDILADVDLRALASAHRSGARVATLVVKPRPAGEGNVGVDALGRVVRVRERVRDGEVRGGDFLGIHQLGASLRASLPARGDLVGDVYLPALRSGATIGVFDHDAEWWDIGTLESYRAANVAWLAARGDDAWIAPTARVASSVELRASVVGEGAIVEGDGVLERCVVWPGARARAPLADAVVAREGVARSPIQK
jgi:mannose-1-phosphate guanylyltransferase